MEPVSNAIFKLSTGAHGFGLSFRKDQLLSLAGVPLLRGGLRGFAARPRLEIQSIVSRAYDVDVDITSLMGGLRVVADALNTGDTAKAMAAAVLLKLPELDWDGAVRIAQADDALAKYDPDEPRDWRGRWTTEGGGNSDFVATPAVFFSDGQQLPVQFVSDPRVDPAARDFPLVEDGPLDGSTESYALPKDWVHLPPGNRIDELGDLLEWIANAKAEDASVLIGEINRVYAGAGDVRGALALHGALYDALQPERVRRTARRSSNSTTRNFPTIDRFSDGIATSWKSLDSSAATYQNPARLSARINIYIDKVARFDGDRWAGKTIRSNEITGRALNLVIRKGSVTEAQQAAIEATRERAKNLGVNFNVIPK